MYQKILLILYVAYLLIVSLIAFIAYGRDKKLASGESETRIKEKTLLALSVYGGSIGALLARLAFHHKTKKITFSIVIYLSLLLQLSTLVAMLIMLI